MSRATITVVLTAMLNGWVLLTTCAAAVDPAPELALCRGKPTVMAALSRATTQARAVPERQRLTVQLSPEKSVALPGTSPDLDKERAKAKGPTYAGVVRLEVTRPGIYRVGTDRDAWVDIATASGKLLDPAPEEGTFTLRRRAKDPSLHPSRRWQLLAAGCSQFQARHPPHDHTGRLSSGNLDRRNPLSASP